MDEGWQNHNGAFGGAGATGHNKEMLADREPSTGRVDGGNANEPRRQRDAKKGKEEAGGGG